MHTDLDLDFEGHEDFGSDASKDGRMRTWGILAYPDFDGHKHIRERLNELDWDYAGIVHDSDDGVKVHQHYVVLCKDGRKAKDIAADLNIDAKWLRPWDSKKRALRYLCHRDHPEKHQYSVDGIFGTLADKAIASCSKSNEMSEVQSVLEVIALLDSVEQTISYSQFMYMVCQRGCYASFRRMGQLAVRLIEEHNNKYRASQAYLEQLERDRIAFAGQLQNSPDFVERCERLERLGFPPQSMGE